MTITEFLLARIAEDEARVEGITSGADPDFFWGPDRIRAECAARRAIMGIHHMPDVRRGGIEGYWWPSVCDCCTMHGEYADQGPDPVVDPCATLRNLAIVYADHKDYDPAWRP